MSDRKYKTIKHQHEVGDFHELTFSCYRKMRLLTNDVWRMRTEPKKQQFPGLPFVHGLRPEALDDGPSRR